MRRLRVEAPSRHYDVLIGNDCLAALGEALREREPGGQVVVCSDEHVAPLYLGPAGASLRAAGYAVSEIVVPAGEREKNLQRVEELYGVLYDRGIRRGDTLVALGGGVVGDLTGFVAATYQRGVRFVQVPTTLLAQVDAAIGGKTGVDFRNGKNYIGAFYQPRLVFADLATLATLPERELRGGCAEVAKYALWRGGRLLDAAEALAAAGPAAANVGEELVCGCAAAKLEVVAADEREETGVRAVLNLGHTIGHAVESAGQLARFTHGEAVAFGLRAALWLSRRLCGLPEDEYARGLRLLEDLGFERHPAGVRAGDVHALVGRDKKAGADGVGYVLLERLGTPRLGVAVPEDLQWEAIEWLLG